MDYLFVLYIALAVFSTGFCATIQTNYSEHETVTVPEKSTRGITLRDFMVCGLTRDISCFLETADTLVKQQMDGVLAQADAQIVKATGRADAENSPSHLAKIINRLISEITDMFKDGLSGFFKSAKEGEDDKIEEESDKKKATTAVGEARKKKKKEKIIALIKLVILGLLIKAKITILLKALAAALQVKYFLLALGAFLLNAAKFYVDVKHGKHPQKVIYYEHAQHQHHYESDDDWASSGPGESDGSYWARTYDEGGSTAQKLAYAKQRPYMKGNNDQSSFSWFG